MGEMRKKKEGVKLSKDFTDPSGPLRGIQRGGDERLLEATNNGKEF